MVFENAVLFMRDALLLREFTDAIKAGDSGRVVLSLKVIALSYRGSGRTNYARELLFLVHNLEHIWPKPLRKIILDNWLVNPTGKPNAYLPVDILQEHMNLWIKTIYSAQGSNASWEWLETVAPCIDILRRLATQVNQSLGSKQGSRHSSPELANDIAELTRSLHDHRVYVVEHGRVIDDPKGEVPNIVAIGLAQLSKPLREYNAAFEQLKTRQQMTPLVGSGTSTPSVDNPSQSSTRARNAPAGFALADTATETREPVTHMNGTALHDTAETSSDGSDADSFAWDALDDEFADYTLALETLDDVAFNMDGF